MLQVLVIAAGVVVPAMYVLGVIFAALWVTGIWLARRHDPQAPALRLIREPPPPHADSLAPTPRTHDLVPLGVILRLSRISSPPLPPYAAGRDHAAAAGGRYRQAEPQI